MLLHTEGQIKKLLHTESQEKTPKFYSLKGWQHTEKQSCKGAPAHPHIFSEI